MKTLYLVRHAKSSWKEAGIEDIKRPLSGRGKEAAPKMGKMLRKTKDFPELIVSSPAKRAFDTARKIAIELDYPVRKIKKDERLYMARSNDFISLIGEAKKNINKLMIVSHNFGLTIFANEITGAEIVNIPTAGVVKVEFDMKKWKEIKNTKGKLVFFITPKKDTNGS